MPKVERVVMKGLAKKPEERFVSVQEFALALEEASRAPTQSFVMPPSTPVPVPDPLVSNMPPMKPPTAPPVAPRWPSAPPVTPLPSSNRSISQAPPPQSVPNPQDAQGYQAQHVHLRPPAPDFAHAGTTLYDASLGQQAGFSGLASEAAQTLRGQTRTFKQALATDKFFLKTPRNRWFLPLGGLLNICSALLILPLHFPESLFYAAIGGIYSALMLWRCIISVKKSIAIAFGAGVALWWGFVIYDITARFFAPYPALSAFAAFFGFAISLAIHIWFVEQRLKY
jgi:hypothetical protein